jgi:hypothetical protein
MFEDGGGAADGFVDGGGLHVDGVVYVATITEGNFAVLDWQRSAFAVEEGEGIVAEGEGFLQGLKPMRLVRAALGLKPQPPKERVKTRALKMDSSKLREGGAAPRFALGFTCVPPGATVGCLFAFC